MDQEGEVADLGISQGQHPHFKTVIELPTVDVLKGVLAQCVSDCAQMQAQLSDILETKLVAD